MSCDLCNFIPFKEDIKTIPWYIVPIAEEN